MYINNYELYSDWILPALLASVASVSMRLGSNERPRNGIYGVLPARKWDEMLATQATALSKQFTHELKTIPFRRVSEEMKQKCS